MVGRRSCRWAGPLASVALLASGLACPPVGGYDYGDGTSAGSSGPSGSGSSGSGARTAEGGTSSPMRSGRASTGGGNGPAPGNGDGPGPAEGTGNFGCDYGGGGRSADGFEFVDMSACDIVQQDRVGVPFVQRLLVTATDDYNVASPSADQTFQFLGEMLVARGALHELLDDDILAQGLLPCGPGACSVVMTPLVIPDALLLDLGAPPGFPNGRHPADPAFDRMLAALLLDADAHPITTYSDLPLSPADNDVPFDANFPYLAPPHP